MLSSRPSLVYLLAALASVLFLITLFTQLHAPSWPVRPLTNAPPFPLNTPPSPSLPSTSPALTPLDPHLLAPLAEHLHQSAVSSRTLMLSESGTRNFPDGYIFPYNVWDVVRPAYPCPHEVERVGTLGDGGKWVCGMARYEALFPPISSPSAGEKGGITRPGPPSASTTTTTTTTMIIYSFGVNDDSSFEAAVMARTNARVWGWDYSVEGWGPQIAEGGVGDRAKFEKAAIGKTDGEREGHTWKTVQGCMAANGHGWVDLVKMDVEGAEFDALGSLVEFVSQTWEESGDGVLPFGQLLVEIHLYTSKVDFGMPTTMKEFLDWWVDLEKMGLRPVWNEHNWIGDVMTGKPRYIEYTFINVRHPKNKPFLEKV
ncbi:hypothetical protein CAC42_7568 [Sphaceloma murrayae]|uniref:Methyltransferase domain-containing protein n=1 Tax=Sphaceloma murrayae TaxID=2082308 RepID=A0A2K1QT72_9PEZI|nr:hypothetical protein CAC42_7568 [Sphaceloma murrayae]